MNQCIFCLEQESSFQSVEHIFPESMGNTGKVLPRGMVCDECNSGVLARLDQELQDFGPIKLMRTFEGVRNKEGKIPSSNFSNLRIDNPNGSNVVLDQLNSHKSVHEITPQGFKLTWKDKKWDVAYLKIIARALYKIGFELLCLDHGTDYILQKRFDEVRSIILGRKDFEGYLLINKITKNYEGGGIRYDFIPKNPNGLAVFRFYYFLTDIIFDLEQRCHQQGNGTQWGNYIVLKF